jgi:hypothetical protein
MEHAGCVLGQQRDGGRKGWPLEFTGGVSWCVGVQVHAQALAGMVGVV